MVNTNRLFAHRSAIWVGLNRAVLLLVSPGVTHALKPPLRRLSWGCKSTVTPMSGTLAGVAGTAKTWPGIALFP